MNQTEVRVAPPTDWRKYMLPIFSPSRLVASLLPSGTTFALWCAEVTNRAQRLRLLGLGVLGVEHGVPERVELL